MNDGKCHPSSWECVNATAEYNSTHYCDSSHKIKTKKADDNTCTANYECQNNNCMNDGKCHPSSWECVNAMQNTTQRITAMQIIRYKAKRQMTIPVLKIMNVKKAIV